MWLVEVLPDGVGGFAGDDGGEGFGGGVLDVAEGAEVGEEALAGLRADAGNVVQLGVAVAHGPALAVIADGEAMALIANELDEMKDGRAAIEDDGLFLIAVEVNDFFPFRDRRERLRGEAEGFEGFGCGVKLAEAAVDEDQGGHWLVFIPQTAVAALDHFAHGGEIVDAGYGFHFEFAIG